MNSLVPARDSSPFDALQLPNGRWSARAIMTAMGYSRWENFLVPLARARKAADNQGHAPDHHFLQSQKVVDRPQGGGTPVMDVHLTRFAAYLVAMNGDPNKPEVAAAQAYFAVKTREAETASVPAAIPSDYPAALEEAARQARRAIEAESRIAELEPKAEVADKLLDAEGDLSVRDAAQSLTRAGVKTGQGRLFAELAQRRWISRAGDGRWRVLQYAIDHGFMSVLPQSHYHPKTGELVMDPPQPRVTPKGLQRLLSDLTKGDAA